MSRYLIIKLVALLSFASIIAAYFLSPHALWPLIVLLPLLALGIYDLVQKKRAILRNYPIIGHIRFLLESVRSEIRQYFIEGERDELPFSLEQRSLVYRRAKQVDDSLPFGTIHDVQAPGHAWLAHAIKPLTITDADFRLTIGGAQCKQPYSASILNISGTSFGSFGAHAIMAFNRGAKLGGFAHNTGEGSISPYHRKYGGDLIWQIASGYFGCRKDDGTFDPDKFQTQAADPQVRMIEIKLSQGAKPGHGGVLPRAKITPEIAETRGIPMGEDCISPAAHSAFSTPIEMMHFIAQLRELSGGKPVGFKLAIGYRHEFMALVKAMIETGITPDFIVIDGAEGGTGAAPLELSNHVGMPVLDGLNFAHSILTGAGLRNQIKLGASGKAISAFDLCTFYAAGADYVMAARAFMFAISCIQARACHTNKCPTGITTQDPLRQKAINVPEKSQRVVAYHRSTMHAFAELLGAAGLAHPEEIRSHYLTIRTDNGQHIRGDERFPCLPEKALLQGHLPESYAVDWQRAQAGSFTALDEYVA